MALTTSVLAGGSNSFQTTSEMINFPITDFIYPGVVGRLTNTSLVAPMTGSFAVNAQGTPDMTVAVSAGACYVTATPASGNSQVVRVKNSASANVTIASNATGGTRYDWIYVKIDATNAANPDSSASNVASLVSSRSTSNTTDNGTPPTYGTLIAVVTVANGASSITNGNIADKRVNAGFRNDNATTEVNSISYGSAATGNAPTISAVGSDANISINIKPKGTGDIQLNGASRAATNFVNTTETTTSTSYAALATAQAVTVTIGANGLALVLISHGGWNNGADAQTLMSYAVSGANTIAAGTYETNHRQATANAAVRAGTHHLLTGLTPGSTTFTAQFRVTSGTGSFYAREITVIPL